MPTADMPQLARLQVGGRALQIDLARPYSIAIEQHFDDSQPQWFGALPARSTALQSGAFNGRIEQGASCNCSTLQLTPHCNGTHTECAGHLTREPLDVQQVTPAGLLPAVLLSITPCRSAECGESSDPPPQPQDRLITRAALAAAWPPVLPFAPVALLIRTLPNDRSKLARNYDREPAAYLSREAAEWMVTRGIEHLVLDVPSADRAADQGRLCAHRLFFGLPPGSTRLADAARAQCSITELAYIDAALADGPWLLMLQLPAWAGEALPSRPLLYAVQSA